MNSWISFAILLTLVAGTARAQTSSAQRGDGPASAQRAQRGGGQNAGQAGGAPSQGGAGQQDSRPRPIDTRFVLIFLPGTPNEAPEKQILGFRIEQISRSLSSGEEPLPCPVTGSNASGYMLSDLKRLLECAAGDTRLFVGTRNTPPNTLEGGIRSRAQAAATALQLATSGRDESTTRAFGEKDDGVLLVAFVNATMLTSGSIPVLVEGPKTTFTFNETARESRFAADLQDLGALAIGVGFRAAADVPDGTVAEIPAIWMDYSLRQQIETRSDITITHKLEATVQLGADFSAEAIAAWRQKTAQGGAETGANELVNAEACKNILAATPSGPSTPENMARRQNPIAIAGCQLLFPVPMADVVRAAAAEALSTRPSPTSTVLLRMALARETAAQNPSQTVVAALTRALAASGGAGQGQSQVAAAPRQAAATDAAAATRSTKVISGSVEHWFLTADVMLSDDLKFGTDDDGGVVLQGKPPTFYVGAGFLLGDLLTSDRPFWQNIVLKGFVKGTSRPQESVGFAIGLRGKYFNWPALNFETLSPFVAVTSTRTESDQPLSERHVAARIGVSVNLDKALGWIAE